MYKLIASLLNCSIISSTLIITQPTLSQPVMLESEFIFEEVPFEQCHASTIAETDRGLVVAWFAGTEEGNTDIGIWISRKEDGAWTSPLEVANGIEPSNEQHPSWNPVLYFDPQTTELLLFYKVGPSPRAWWGVLKKSGDGGKTWSKPTKLPEDIVGPVRNKPVLLADGQLLCPSSSEDHGWRIHFETTLDLGTTWETTGPINNGKQISAIQPTILIHPNEILQALCRSKRSGIVESWSMDGGQTWSDLKPTTLPNPNSGIDGVTLKDGNHLLVYNPTSTPEGEWGGARSPLAVTVSKDGKEWQKSLTLEKDEGEYSYPAVIQSSDGLIHITYTWQRARIKHVVLDPTRLKIETGSSKSGGGGSFERPW